MIYIALKSEYSFQNCYYHLNQLVDDAAHRGDSAVGLADINNTFGHVRFQKLCKANKIKPIFGVRLQATEQAEKSRSYRETYNTITNLIFLAKNDKGLVEIYKLVNSAYDQFYYFPRLTYEQVGDCSDDVYVIIEGNVPCEINVFNKLALKRADYISHQNPMENKNSTIAIPHVIYSKISDIGIYETLCHFKGTDNRTYGGYIKSEEGLLLDGFTQEAINETDTIAENCIAKIKRADMVKFTDKKDIEVECQKGAIRLNIDIWSDEIYKARYEHEMELIKSRDFGDYFLIVSDMLLNAKNHCLVGPGRGSSGGSLICYLLGITEIDPIKHELLFERFIDINRMDLPDIDTDIPDVKRQEVIKYVSKKYGEDNVRSIGTISTFKPKIAIGDFAKSLGIPAYDTDDIKNAIIERNTGDARAQMCILDTIEGTESGKRFIEQYPQMKIVQYIEGHARHSGKHAAGIIVANDPLYNYGGIDSRESIIMMDGKEAESIGLLKIDILGLRTLSILADTARLAGFEYKDFYNLPLNDPDTFKIFNDGRLYGVFQFEGNALKIVTKQMGVESFDDICAITSLGRPGALNSGGTAKYIKRRIGQEEIESFGKIYDGITSKTYGIVIYQEQTMKILKDFGGLVWEDVHMLRKAMSKSYGDEYFATYKEKFVKGGIENGYTEDECNSVWKAVASMGSYGFNKSHAVAYSMISYWTAYCKAHYPLEFAAANLNHAKDTETAVKILRDFVVNDGIEYMPIDPDLSDINWTIKNGKLIGGLTNLPGIALRKAQDIIKRRESGTQFTPAIAKMLLNPKTPFDIIFPTKHYWGKLYKEPEKFGLIYPPVEIKTVNDPGEYMVVGLVTKRDLRDRNDVQSVMKRGSKVEENQFYLNLYIEDDTDTIKCTIPPYSYDDLNGQWWAENAIPGETWVLVKGKVRDNWRSISIDSIFELNQIRNQQ